MLIKAFFSFKDRDILLQEEMLIKYFSFKDREILLQEEMLTKDLFQGQGNLASGRDAVKIFFQGQGNLASGRGADKRFSPRTGKSYFRKRC